MIIRVLFFYPLFSFFIITYKPQIESTNQEWKDLSEEIGL